jgi:L-gulono-1,4-lactone dehydrogenase
VTPRPVWRNHTGDQSCRPRAILSPASLDELVGIVRRAEREGATVRAVGSGHSWSDVALTDGYLLLPDLLSGVVPFDDGTQAAVDEDRLVRVLGGTRIRELNGVLDRAGQALIQMGGYDGQTVAGVVATSTHGSGLRWGPFPDFVRQLELVASGGEVLRVEPADGITDAQAFADAFGGRRRLIQDDDTFFAAVCGMGSMGIVYSLVLDVRERFFLNEVRTLSTWEDVRGDLTPGGVLGDGDHYELFVNPYARRDGRHTALVTRRADCADPSGLPSDLRERHPLTELAASLPLTHWMLRAVARTVPSLIAGRFEATLRGMCDAGYAAISYRVFNIGEANGLPAYSMELGLPIDGRHVEGVDRILAFAAEHRRGPRAMVQTSPFSLRFVAPSKAYASMMFERPTMMVELIMVVGTPRGHRLLAAYEDLLADLGVRAHWGQRNALDGAKVRAAYPRWDAWLAVERRLNAGGVFDSEFTRRVGISG